MPLSDREQRLLAGLEDQLNRQYPDLADRFRGPVAPPHPRPMSDAGLGTLVVVLVTLVLAHPLAAAWGAGGVGLLTAALIVPWLVVTARTRARRRHPEPGGSGMGRGIRDHHVPRRARAALRGVAALWALVVAVLVAGGVDLMDAALVAVLLVVLVGVPVVQWFARRALARRSGLGGGEAGAED